MKMTSIPTPIPMRILDAEIVLVVVDPILRAVFPIVETGTGFREPLIPAGRQERSLAQEPPPYLHWPSMHPKHPLASGA
jgi:hypothetical protein